jgi:hypothetical protein
MRLVQSAPVASRPGFRVRCFSLLSFLLLSFVALTPDRELSSLAGLTGQLLPGWLARPSVSWVSCVRIFCSADMLPEVFRAGRQHHDRADGFQGHPDSGGHQDLLTGSQLAHRIH